MLTLTPHSIQRSVDAHHTYHTAPSATSMLLHTPHNIQRNINAPPVPTQHPAQRRCSHPTVRQSQTQPLQPSSAALMAHYLPSNHTIPPTATAQCGADSRSRGRWSEPIGHTWRLRGRTARCTAATSRSARPICLSQVRISVHGELWAGLTARHLRRLV